MDEDHIHSQMFAYKLEAVSVSVTELEAAWQRKKHATEDFNAICESVALTAKIEPAVLRAYVNARMQDKLEANRKKAEQLTLLLDLA